MREVPTHNHHVGELSYSDSLAKYYDKNSEDVKYAPTLTFQVTENCPLACTYCYQGCKSKQAMDLETAKKTVDLLLEDSSFYGDTIGLTIDFIGGEPLLEIDLIRDIYEYFMKRCIELNHPWALIHRVSICTSGVTYFNPKVLKFLEDYKETVSLSVSIDGVKELHDTCRIFPNGEGSYDKAMAAVKYHREHFGDVGTKFTISPDNVQYIGAAILNMFENGWSHVNANCIFEKGWEVSHATEFYYQLKKLADIFYEKDWYEDYSTSLFDERSFDPKDYSKPDENRNWCGGTGSMLAVDYRGKFYPCLRYMPSSLNGEQEPLVLGDVDNGLCKRDCEKCLMDYLNAITATSQSEEKCIECPIASGCAWCSGLNYQETGDVNKRITHICVMHKARALANVYYWNKFYEKKGLKAFWENYVPDEWALEIIGEEELNNLKALVAEQKRRSET